MTMVQQHESGVVGAAGQAAAALAAAGFGGRVHHDAQEAR
jgi:hypothetical protein